MSTVDKALKLLDLFTESRPEAGLGELARMAGYDKATARRFLVALGNQGFIEQDTESRKYRLGAALLRLARVREATFPTAEIVQPVLNALRDETSETAHFSLATGNCMATMLVAESPRANRVSLEDSEPLPFHCTASGIAWLAFAPTATVRKILSKPLQVPTRLTITDPAGLQALIDQARQQGLAIADQTYEDDVHGIASPVFDARTAPIGAIAVATPVSRVTRETSLQIRQAVHRAGLEITRMLGGKPPETFLNITGAV
jgi:IclR family transcriptional regulator, acetate operon repressor